RSKMKALHLEDFRGTADESVEAWLATIPQEVERQTGFGGDTWTAEELYYGVTAHLKDRSNTWLTTLTSSMRREDKTLDFLVRKLRKKYGRRDNVFSKVWVSAMKTLNLPGRSDESPPKFDRKGNAVSSWSKTAKKDPLSIAALQALIMTAGLARSDAQQMKQAAKATKAKVLEVKAEAHDEIKRAHEQPQRDNVDDKNRVAEADIMAAENMADEEVADEDIEAGEDMEAVVEVDLDITGLRLTDLPSWSRRRIPDAVTATKLVTGGKSARTEQQRLTKYLTHGNNNHRQIRSTTVETGALLSAGIEYPNGSDKENDAEPTNGRSKEKSGGSDGQNWGKSSKPSEVTGNEAAEAVEERTKAAEEDDEQKEQGSPVEVVDLASVAATGGSQEKTKQQ
ncbi:putative Polyprotein, partial [Phytophthora megakarya]